MNRDMKHSRGSQAFSVPNTPEGKEFLGLMHRFRQRNWRLVVRARGKRSVGHPGSDAEIDTRTWNRDLPIPYAEWFAVYLREPDRHQLLSLAAYRAGFNAGQGEANRDLLNTITSLRFALAEAARWDVRTLNTERDVAREMLAEAEREAARLRDQVRGLDTKLSMRLPLTPGPAPARGVLLDIRLEPHDEAKERAFILEDDGHGDACDCDKCVPPLPERDPMDLVRQAEEDHSDDVCQSCGDVDCHRNHGHIAGEDDSRLGGER